MVCFPYPKRNAGILKVVGLKPASVLVTIGKGQMGSTLMGSLRCSNVVRQRDLLVLTAIGDAEGVGCEPLRGTNPSMNSGLRLACVSAIIVVMVIIVMIIERKQQNRRGRQMEAGDVKTWLE